MAKREDILQATIDVVAKQGISSTSTEHIAKEAGAAQLTVFRLFGSKKGLFRQTNDEVSQRIHNNLWPEVEKEQASERKLETFLRTAIKYFRKRPTELAYMQEYIHSADGLSQRPDFLCEKGEDISKYPIILILKEGKEQSVFKSLRMSALVGFVGAPLIMALREEQLMNIKLKNEEIDLLIQSCLQAVKA